MFSEFVAGGRESKGSGCWDGLCGTTFVRPGGGGCVVTKHTDMFEGQVGVRYFKDEIS